MTFAVIKTHTAIAFVIENQDPSKFPSISYKSEWESIIWDAIRTLTGEKYEHREV